MRNESVGRIIRGHGHSDFVAGNDTNFEALHFSAELGEDRNSAFEQNGKISAARRRRYSPCQFYIVVS
jgi:hypothetical protein